MIPEATPLLLALNGATLAIMGGLVHVPPPPSVELQSACPHRFQAGGFGRIARWFRDVGYTVPILSHDRRFDETWSLQTRNREFGEALVREQPARAAIEALARLGCVGLSHDGRKLHAVLQRHPLAEMQSEEHQRAVREQLVALDGVISRLCRRHSFPHHAGSGRLITAIVVLGLALVAGFTGIVLGAGEIVDGELGPLALRSLLVSGPLTLLTIVAMALLLAGRSSSHQELGVVVLLAVLGVPLFGVGAAVHINRTLDHGAATVSRVPVLALEQRRGEGKHRAHFAVVRAWREDREPTQRIKLSPARAALIVPGRSWLRITTSPGRLRAERLLDLAVEDGGTEH